jgi:hypothetical protein
LDLWNRKDIDRQNIARLGKNSSGIMGVGMKQNSRTRRTCDPSLNNSSDYEKAGTLSLFMLDEMIIRK